MLSPLQILNTFVINCNKYIDLQIFEGKYQTCVFEFEKDLENGVRQFQVVETLDGDVFEETCLKFKKEIDTDLAVI